MCCPRSTLPRKPKHPHPALPRHEGEGDNPDSVRQLDFQHRSLSATVAKRDINSQSLT